jgi:hypothetical protein
MLFLVALMYLHHVYIIHILIELKILPVKVNRSRQVLLLFRVFTVLIFAQVLSFTAILINCHMFCFLRSWRFPGLTNNASKHVNMYDIIIHLSPYCLTFAQLENSECHITLHITRLFHSETQINDQLDISSWKWSQLCMYVGTW